MKQLTHNESSFEEKKFPVVLILDGVTSPANMGSLFRLSDAFNIEKLILCGPTMNLKSNRLRRTARSTIEKVNFETQDSISQTCEKYASLSFALLALEITGDSIPIDSFKFNQYSKVALIVGNERSGVSEEVLSYANARVHIRMFGKNSSMNVANATGIALYEITKNLSHV